jgi:hypothetical protein
MKISRGALMSQLKINNLSFCEIDFDSSRKVKGGSSEFDAVLSYYRTKLKDFSSAAAKSDMKYLKQSFAKYGYNASYEYDDAKGGYSLKLSKKNGKAKTYSGVTKSYYYNGKGMSSYSSATM